MAKMPNTRIILVEGDTEISIFNNLKRLGEIQAKKVVKKNLWCECIKSYSINIPKSCDVIIVFDTDVINQADRFIKNINYLLSRKHNVILMQQTSNFEDEIAYCCSLSIRNLFSKFCKTKTPSPDDFKRDFIACTNQIEKLKNIGWDKKKWFIRQLHPSITILTKHQSNYDKYF